MDRLFNSDLHRKAQALEKAWHSSILLNRLRRVINPTVCKIKYKIGIKGSNPVRLHLGCGEQRFDDYINIDLNKTRATDLVCDINKLPYPDLSVERIEAYHVIEHLPRHDLPKALKNWFRVMAPGGVLVIECPDLDKVIAEYIKGNEKRINSIFGLQRFPGDTHLFGYNFKRLSEILAEVGFKNIQMENPRDYHAKDEPCLRIRCIKPNKIENIRLNT